MKKYLVKQPNHGKMEDKISLGISRGKAHLVDFYLDEEGYYRDSAIITADSLDKVFEEGNFQEYNDNIEYLDTFYSVSVGDVIVDLETKEMHMVARLGFTKLWSLN
tara:strand:+ start:154 stop:471 length:318 start_codon:yes stop_codon:yes gene_type:complete